MLATRLAGILPPLDSQAALEAAAIQSIANNEFDVTQWRVRPVRSPHHSCSAAALVGGGTHPRPGEISLAHRGLLFLDEFTEFSRSALEQLREPMEAGYINIARASIAVEFPARFILVAACNPCICGYLNDLSSDRCTCSASQIERYKSKLSGPLIDRLDMHLQLNRVSVEQLQSDEPEAETSEIIQAQSNKSTKNTARAARKTQLRAKRG